MNLSKSQNTNQRGQGLNINISEQPTYVCGIELEDNVLCEGDTFFPVVFFKTLSALISPSGAEEIVPVQTFRCSSCGSIPNHEIFPKP
jgi:hypothetical protein